MVESIGKPCECIFNFEKHYIQQALDKLIESSEEELEKLKKI